MRLVRRFPLFSNHFFVLFCLFALLLWGCGGENALVFALFVEDLGSTFQALVVASLHFSYARGEVVSLHYLVCQDVGNLLAVHIEVVVEVVLEQLGELFEFCFHRVVGIAFALSHFAQLFKSDFAHLVVIEFLWLYESLELVEYAVVNHEFVGGRY